MEWISDPQIWIAFATLLALEVVLGIDNVIFIAILADKLPEHQRGKARNLGLASPWSSASCLLSIA
jgi:predicted tellurium resistance membrane protein TerC